jgi:alcohol dehydrogenase
MQREFKMDHLVAIEGIKKTIFGTGSISCLGQECRYLGVSRVLVVFDPGLSSSGLEAKIHGILKKARVKPIIFKEIMSEPSPVCADEGARIAREEKVKGVIGIGGGSTMDIAKAISVLAKNEGRAQDFIGLNLVKKPGLPAIMVPTTAGTGSEVTFTAVFTMRETKTKGGINSPFLYPHVAVLDPELTLGLPPEVTAFTGMDALTHAVESFTSLQAHFLSEPISLEAIRLISAHLRKAVFQGDDIETRSSMMRGSYLAGMGLAMAGVGAVHALAYPLGALFDIPHGIANALLLPYVMEYNFPGDMEKFSILSEVMEEEVFDLSLRETAAYAAHAVRTLSRDIGIPQTLEELNIPKEVIPEMAEGAFKVERPMKNNPRPMTVKDIEEIYRKAYSEG